MEASTDEKMEIYKALGCRDVQMCAIAAMVCQDLQASSKFSKIEGVFNPELNLIYFRCNQENDEHEIVVPHNSCQSMNLIEMEDIQRGVGVDAKCITLACCEPSSGVLYYSAYAGFKDK